MSKRRLKKDFFEREAEEVALDLLGKVLVRKLPDGSQKEGMIVETEAYVGEHDLASHAAGGTRTKRTEVMYGPAGFSYVYFVYGVHWLLNVVCSRKEDPQAVLIRGLEEVSGPARVTKFLEVDGELNGEDVVESSLLWFEDRGIKISESKIKTTPRVGVDYAKEWKDKPLRFVVESS